MLKKYVGDLFLQTRFYLGMAISILFFIASFFTGSLYMVAYFFLLLFALLALADYTLLFFALRQPAVQRVMGERFSNGDANMVELQVFNKSALSVNMEIIEELPEQFQLRDFVLKGKFEPWQERTFHYVLTPTQRGLYEFGYTHLYVSTILGLLSRRFSVTTNRDIPVYPSFMQMNKYQLMSQSAVINEKGSKQLRKLGHSLEFEQIKEYVTGDDVRTLNWKATARKGMLMVNNYTDERSQQVYCIIDKGRLMKMPFGGLTLLDYAINSTLVLSNVCLHKQDKAGLFTFSEKMGNMIAADRKPIQREKIMESLYRLQTSFLESDFEMLYLQVRQRIKQRSLLILYTNFESLNGLHRQLDYLRSIARHHLLLVVFFENTELVKLSHADAWNVEDVYVKTIADKFVFEKKLIVKELSKYGILSLLTSPGNLTVNTVNKYLELKSRQAI